MARFDLRPGAQIETATPDEVAEVVARQFEARAVEEYTRRKDAINLDAAGAGQKFEHVGAQYDWLIQRVTIAGTGAPSALVQIFENQQNPLDLLEVIQLGTGGIYSDGFDNTLYVPALAKVLIVVTAGVASGQLSYNFQIRRLHRKAP